MLLQDGKIKVLMLKGEKGDKGDPNYTYALSKVNNQIVLTGSDGTETSVEDSDTTYTDATTSAHGLMSASDKAKLNNIPNGSNIVTYAEQNKTTAQRMAALANCGIHVGNTPPENVTTDTVPVGELYVYFEE